MSEFDSQLFDTLMEAKHYVQADELLKEQQGLMVDSHWHWTQWAYCKRELGDAKGALYCANKALELAPTCPLALWEQASSLEMCELWAESIEAYDFIIGRGVHGLIDDPCNEGKPWTLRLLADCWFYRGSCLAELDRIDEAIDSYYKHIELRGSGRGLVVTADVEREICKLEKRR